MITNFRPAVADADGVVRFLDLGEETFRFRYSQRSGSRPFQAKRIPAEVFVERAAVVTGRVQADGRGMPGAEIWCAELGGTSSAGHFA